MNSDILIYQNANGNIKIDVRLEEETVWLTQDQLATLFGKAKSTINEHIKNIYEENVLEESATEFEKYRITQKALEREESLKEIEADINKLKKPKK
jgi:hypothetical protein